MKPKYSISFHPEAEKEYLESVKWYESALSGLGDDFINEIEITLNRIDSNPLLFPIKKFNLREAVVKKFPFIIVFELKPKESEIRIVSVFHTSRNSKKKLRK